MKDALSAPPAGLPGSAFPPQDRLLTIAETASILRMAESTVRRMAQKGRLPGALEKLGGAWRINERLLLEYLQTASRHARSDDTTGVHQNAQGGPQQPVATIPLPTGA